VRCTQEERLRPRDTDINEESAGAATVVSYHPGDASDLLQHTVLQVDVRVKIRFRTSQHTRRSYIPKVQDSR
jgi:hypothetical protein